nr:CS1 type fimbrial major subunit [Yersinia bercovieri]
MLLISSTTCYSAPVVKNIPVEATIMSTVTITKANDTPLEHIELKYQPRARIAKRYFHTEDIKLTTNVLGKGVNIGLKEEFVMKGSSDFDYRLWRTAIGHNDELEKLMKAARKLNNSVALISTVTLAGKRLSTDYQKYTLGEISDNIPLSINAGILRGELGDMYKGTIKLVVEPIL